MASISTILRCSSCGTLDRVLLDKLTNHPLCGKCKTALHYPSAPINATTATFDKELIDWRELLLVEFWSRTCGHCRTVEPVVNDIAHWKAGRLKVVKVEVQEEFALAQRFQAKATPTFILFRNGQQLARVDGAPKEKLDMVRWIDKYLE